MAIRPLLVDKRSPYLGEFCALCKEPFAPGEEIIICPEDGARHHVFCWTANGNRCAAFGCEGHGTPISRTPPFDDEPETREEPEPESPSRVKTLPASNFSCAQSCLVVAIAISIVVIAVSCFGLWAMLDYILVEILGWHYRQPISEFVTILPAMASASWTVLALLPA